MKAAFFAGQGRVEVRQVPQPEPGPGEVLLRVRASALCGSELHAYRGQGSGEDIPGHEIVGEDASGKSGKVLIVQESE